MRGQQYGQRFQQRMDQPTDLSGSQQRSGSHRERTEPTTVVRGMIQRWYQQFVSKRQLDKRVSMVIQRTLQGEQPEFRQQESWQVGRRQQ